MQEYDYGSLHYLQLVLYEAISLQNQKDLISFLAEINWRRDESVLRRVEAADRFVALRAIRFHPQGQGRRHALPVGIDRKEPWGNRRNLHHASGDLSPYRLVMVTVAAPVIVPGGIW